MNYVNRNSRCRFLLILALILLVFSGCTAPEQAGSDSAGSGIKSGSGQELKVTFLDVGQGDSTFIELPEGECMLIDAAEPEYSDEILTYIKEEGYDSIDYLVSTHPHSDHIGGMRTIVEELGIGTVYMPKVQNNTQMFENLLKSIRAKGLKIQTARAGTEIFSDEKENLAIEVVAPNEDSYSDLNDYSAVIRLSYGDTSFLFMGDAEKRSEKEIAEEIQADVLKVGHHGSDYSSGSDFLNDVSPDYAVISCGKGNKYGHPNKETLDKLKKIHAEILRTDRQGDIVITSNGSEISVLDENGKETAKTVSKADSKEDTGADNVYITKSGSKYHRADCYTLKSEPKCLTEKEARAQGYEPCSKCNP